MKLSFFLCTAYTVVFLLFSAGCGTGRSSIDLANLEPENPIEVFNGQDFGNWKPLTDAPYEIPGKVEIKQGVISVAPGNSFSGFFWNGEVPRSHYELEISARRVAGSDIFCGLAFPVGTNYCSMILGGWGNSIAGLSNVNYGPAADNETGCFMQFEDKKWYKVRLRVTDDYIKGWVDDNLIIELQLFEKHISQYVGLEIFEPFGFFTWETGAEVKDIYFKRVYNRKTEL